MVKKNYQVFTHTFSGSQPLGLHVNHRSKTHLANNSVLNKLKTNVVVVEIFSKPGNNQAFTLNLDINIGDVVTHIGKRKFTGDIDDFVEKIGEHRLQEDTYTVTFARANSITKDTPVKMDKKKKKSTRSSSNSSTRSKRSASKGRQKKKLIVEDLEPEEPVVAVRKKAKSSRKRASSKGGKYSNSKPKTNNKNNENDNEIEYAKHFSRHGTRVPDQGDQDKTRLHNDIPVFVALTTYLGYVVLTIFGRLRDFFGKLTGHGRYFSGQNAMPKDKAALVDSWDNFYVRRMKHRINDIFQRPVTGPPAASGMNLLVRDTPDQNKTFQLTGETKRKFK